MGLDLVDFVMEIEGTFCVSLGDQTLERIRTVGDLQEWLSIASERWEHGSQELLYGIISSHLGVPASDIRPHSRFVEDLHAD